MLRDVAARIRARIGATGARSGMVLAAAGESNSLRPCWRHLAATMTAHFGAARLGTAAQRLMELELAVALVENWTRAAALDLAMAGVRQ